MRFFRRGSPKVVQATPAQGKGYGLQRPVIFSHLSEHDLSQLYLAATIKHFQKDQYILKEGDACNCLYIVLNGDVRIIYGNNAHTHILHSGDFFGDIEFKENFVNIYSATAIEPVMLMEINCRGIDHLPDSVQLIIYKKLSKFSMHNIYYLSIHNDKVNAINIELTAYIHRMKSQTDAFITS